jgi:phosphate:Na+ symporter
MDLFNVLTLIGGLSLFLFGMSLLGSGLERRAGGSLKTLLGKLTTNRVAGFLTGLGVTSVIQSSSATTVMVVGFVNSGLMTLRQAIGVIMGANVGTTVTAWILSLTGIESTNVFVRLLEPSSFTPILALVGIILYMMCKSSKKKDTGLILLGFATLMFGMDTMSGSVASLRSDPGFQSFFLTFSNPILGVLAGAAFTGIIQSSSASIGILQALSTTGQVTFGSAIPILMGMDIGTCVTALLSSVGTNRNARRAALAHLLFNIIGTVVFLGLFYLGGDLFNYWFLGDAVNVLDIAIINTTYKLLLTALMLPQVQLLEKLVCRLIPDAKTEESANELDERLLATPAVAIERCRIVANTMAQTSMEALKDAVSVLRDFDPKLAQRVRDNEQEADHFEDILGTYLVKLSSREMSDKDSGESAKLLHMIGDFERISDHAVNILESAEEAKNKGISFTVPARRELKVITDAVIEICDMSMTAFAKDDLQIACQVEPLEQVVDALKEQLRTRHILRLQRGECSIEAGFIWSDLLTNLERVADHCSNIAGCVIEMSHSSLELHEYLNGVKAGSREFIDLYHEFARKYALVPPELERGKA